MSTFWGGVSAGSTVPVTVTAATLNADASVTNYIFTIACVITFPSAAQYSGKSFMLVVESAAAITSATSNVIPRIGGAAGTAILPATDGAWALVVSDGTNWKIMASGV
jgi:hypothetical protein